MTAAVHEAYTKRSLLYETLVSIIVCAVMDFLHAFVLRVSQRADGLYALHYLSSSKL
jgi:hypothetical protein